MKLPMLLTAVAALALTTPAQAELLRFQISGDYSATFLLPSNPVPAPENVFDGFLFGLAGVAGFPTLSGTADISFFANAATGGILISDPDAFDYLLDANGAQLYSGTEAAPVFVAGTSFTLTGLTTPGTFRVTIAAVPEPASWAMMIAGFGIAGVAMRRRAARPLAIAV